MTTVGHHVNRTGHPDLLSRCAGNTGRVYIQSTDPGIIEHRVCVWNHSVYFQSFIGMCFYRHRVLKHCCCGAELCVTACDHWVEKLDWVRNCGPHGGTQTDILSHTHKHTHTHTHPHTAHTPVSICSSRSVSLSLSLSQTSPLYFLQLTTLISWQSNISRGRSQLINAASESQLAHWSTWRGVVWLIRSLHFNF